MSRPRGPRRPPTGRWVGVGLVVVVLGAVAGIALGTSTFAITDVTVLGVGPENTPAVAQAADVPVGDNLLLLDTSDVAGRVLTIPRVARVDVRRSLPGTVTITVAEREPVLSVPAADGQALVDDTGLAYRTVPTRPAGIPLLHLPPGVAPRPEDPATRASVAVVTALPAALRRSVTDVAASGAYDVSFTVGGGRTVRWGAADDNARKAAVLAALLTRPGHTYDVSTPELSVVS